MGIDHGGKWASLGGKGRKEKDEETGDRIHVLYGVCFDAVFSLCGMLCRSRVIEKRDPEFIDLYIAFILSKWYNHIVHNLVLYNQFFCLIDD